jgi:hypothetical protein
MVGCRGAARFSSSAILLIMGPADMVAGQHVLACLASYLACTGSALLAPCVCEGAVLSFVAPMHGGIF